MTILVCLVLNFLLYFFASNRYGRKGKMSLTYTLSVYYAFVAFMGIVICSTGIYEAVLSINYNKEIDFSPYIYCFVSIMVLIYPFRNVTYKTIKWDEIPYNNTVKWILNIWIIITSLYMMLNFSNALVASQMGYDSMYEAFAVDGSAQKLLYGNNFFLIKFVNFNINLMNSFSPFVMCYSLYGLISKKISQSRAFLLLGLIFFSKFFSALAIGSRGNLFFVFWSFAFYIIIFYPHLNFSLKRKFKKIGVVSFSVVAFYSVLISIARLAHSDSETPLTSVARYFGECFPNLGLQFWNQVTMHPYGTRLFPYIFGIEYNAESVQDGYAFWKTFTGVPVLIFKTIFGDLYIEFGLPIALAIILIIALIFYFFIGRGKIHFWKLALIYWYFDLIIQGIFGFNKDGWSNFIVLIAILIVSFIVKIYTQKKQI